MPCPRISFTYSTKYRAYSDRIPASVSGDVAALLFIHGGADHGEAMIFTPD